MRVLAFLAALGAVFGLAYACGGAVDPIGEAPSHDEHGGDSYELVLADKGFEPGARELEFRIERDGRPVTSYDTVHEKELHFIAVRQDFSGYQHVHPTLTGDTWRTRVDLSPGKWRLYADFTPTGGPAQVLSPRIEVRGQARDNPLTSETRSSVVDGYAVTLEGDLSAGTTTVLHPLVTRGGKPVTDLEPYLGALGHLVALRHETLDYLHVHPEGLDFHTSVEKPGTYELFLEFKHEGKVHLARFTLPTRDSRTQPEPTGVEHGEHSGH